MFKKIITYYLLDFLAWQRINAAIAKGGAMMHARIGRLVFGAAEGRVGATSRLEKLRGLGADFNHRFPTEGGLLADEASALLLDFFRERRAERVENHDRPNEMTTTIGEVPKWS